MDDNRRVEIGERIKTTRQLRGLSQAAVAKRMGKTYQADVAKFEQGISPHMSVSRLSRLAAALDISLAYLLEGGEAGPTSPAVDPKALSDTYQENYAQLVALESSLGGDLRAAVAYSLAERDVAAEQLSRRLDELTVALARKADVDTTAQGRTHAPPGTNFNTEQVPPGVPVAVVDHAAAAPLPGAFAYPPPQTTAQQAARSWKEGGSQTINSGVQGEVAANQPVQASVFGEHGQQQ